MGTIIISTATVLVCFGYVQRVDVGRYISLMAIGLETAVGDEDTVAATARYSDVVPPPPPCPAPGLMAESIYGGDIQSISTNH